jgi:hypothetical protein
MAGMQDTPPPPFGPQPTAPQQSASHAIAPVAPNKSGTLDVVLALLVIGAPIAYAIWAQVGEPAEPAASYIRWQASWGDGRYYMKATFLATLLTVAIPMTLLGSAVWVPKYIFNLMRAPQVAMPSGPTWVSAQRSGPAWSIVGVLLLLLCSAGFAQLALEPERFAFLGSGSAVLFMLLPVGFLVGWFSLLNLLLPARKVLGTITHKLQRTDAKGNVVAHVIRVGEAEWSVSATTWTALQVGQLAFVCAPAISTNVRTLLVQTSPHYR